MKRIPIVILIIFILLSTISCNKYSKNSIYQVKHINDIECSKVPYNVSQIQSRIDTSFINSYFPYFNSNNNTLGIFFLEKNYKISIPIPLKKLIKKRRTNSDFYFYSLDSIFYFDRDLLGVFLFDSLGTIINKFSIKSKYPPNPITSNFFIFSKNSLYYSWLPKSDMSTRGSRKQTFEAISPICKVKIDNIISSANGYSSFSEYPNNYKTGNNYYNYGPNIYVGLNNQIISSYQANHNIYIYKNSELIAQKACRSNFIYEFDNIPDEYNSNLSYCQTFIGKEPKYTKFIVDPYNKWYYRITKLRMSLKKTDMKNAKWSIIILNDSFDIIGEALLPYSDYMPDIIIPSKEGLYIKRTAKSKEEFNGNLFLSLIQFTQ